ncbi:SDR family NAD(P)-dependent oxidoreductase [Litoreibacter roseus]|uniref:Short-chain dehydrogenase n=1 Tax=Litoreibacter roseus TaxID=2601869 RepID=A0A6N6JH91_9RHOB|nr:SDR family NAD(P)-dependent oxidoreductase [Litoreibacter roseus]GFE65317.1 short-chain dehydrogenase [Litoreibacter roseus]
MHVLITGATRGIGRAMFDAYKQEGTDVTGTYRGTEPDGSGWLQLDVSDPTSTRDLCTSLDGKAVDLLVCNAGIYDDKHENLADGYPAEMWARMFATNVTGVFLTVQNMLPQLQMSEQPKIAIISSQMASSERAPGGSYIYRSSKAAALNLGRNLAADLKDLGIAVGIYHPGWVQTDMGGSAAQITPEDSAAGLIKRFHALSLESTGVFETWDGHQHPY